MTPMQYLANRRPDRDDYRTFKPIPCVEIRGAASRDPEHWRRFIELWFCRYPEAGTVGVKKLVPLAIDAGVLSYDDHSTRNSFGIALRHLAASGTVVADYRLVYSGTRCNAAQYDLQYVQPSPPAPPRFGPPNSVGSPTPSDAFTDFVWEIWRRIGPGVRVGIPVILPIAVEVGFAHYDDRAWSIWLCRALTDVAGDNVQFAGLRVVVDGMVNRAWVFRVERIPDPDESVYGFGQK